MADENGYRVPCGEAESGHTEKRSRFLGHVWGVSDEEEARARIEETRRRHHDARHHCWCYLLRQGGIARWSDDGEPQGSAGRPMLAVFQGRGVTDVCCVVTRWFGGVLLGTGGLTRAYSKAAKDALDAAGTALLSRWTLWDIACPYAFVERAGREIRQRGGRVRETAWGEAAVLRAALLPGTAGELSDRLRDLSAGTVSMTETGEVWLPGEREDASPGA